ncbi:MAG TPA: DUF721 domain-containing protein [Gaiellaceae bacterium]|nr:DUF721 domain-containing protein [Gaiellaceae bacterium]
MERLGDEVGRQLGRFGPQGAIADVVAVWPGAVGDAIARNAWPARMARDGTLHVATSSSAWAFELTHLAPELLARLGSLLAESAPKALKFSPGPVPDSPTLGGGTPVPTSRRDPTQEERALAAAISAEIEDEELRKLVARAAAASLAGQRAGRSV